MFTMARHTRDNDGVLGANLSISEYFHVGLGSGQAQLDQVLLKVGVHVHSVCLLMFCLHIHHNSQQ